MVELRVQSRVPCVLVGLHDVYLRAWNSAHTVGIAIIILARGLELVLVHGNQVECNVAATPCVRQVHSVPKGSLEQVHSQVILIIIFSCVALLSKVSPSIHVRSQLVAVDLDLLHSCQVRPSCRNQRYLWIGKPLDAEVAWTILLSSSKAAEMPITDCEIDRQNGAEQSQGEAYDIGPRLLCLHVCGIALDLGTSKVASQILTKT
mmetsp:Transcript_13609/g.48034  ORF Transcript_13609/g.48034 Transcript_13609/m.48034 type:complete len:205 (-) Transcript_13609:2-616(-)